MTDAKELAALMRDAAQTYLICDEERMLKWDQIRRLCELRDGASLPRDMFEDLVCEIEASYHNMLRATAAALEAQSGMLASHWPQTPDDLFIVIAAFRYALPRGSYAHLVADWIDARKNALPALVLAQIVAEIRAECERPHRSLPPPPHMERWLKLAEALVAL